MGCTVLFFPRTVLLAAEAQSPDLSRLLALALIASIRRRIADITSISLCSGYRRITDYLLELASVDIERDSGRYRTSIVLPAGKAIIAAWMNVTAEYFSRALHYLTVRGAIGVKGRHRTFFWQSKATYWAVKSLASVHPKVFPAPREPVSSLWAEVRRVGSVRIKSPPSDRHRYVRKFVQLKLRRRFLRPGRHLETHFVETQLELRET